VARLPLLRTRAFAAAGAALRPSGTATAPPRRAWRRMTDGGEHGEREPGAARSAAPRACGAPRPGRGPCGKAPDATAAGHVTGGAPPAPHASGEKRKQNTWPALAWGCRPGVALPRSPTRPPYPGPSPDVRRRGAEHGAHSGSAGGAEAKGGETGGLGRRRRRAAGPAVAGGSRCRADAPAGRRAGLAAGRIVLAAGVLAGGGPAEAASFPCAKATGAVETTICSDARLSRLDEQLGRAYAAAARALGATPAGRSGGPDDGTAAPLRESQRAWLAERDRCGTAVPCLKRRYERRIAVLGFGPDPDAPGPVDRFVGRYTDGRQARGAVLRVGPDRAAVLLNDAEPAQGRWLCEFRGIGVTDPSGTRLVATSCGEPGYTLRASPRGLQLGDDSGGAWCGMNGAIASPLRRRR
jgi:uncharacterized protein YecT (DUF1311 family)